ncbi:hypothetical protein FDUTEX481_08144 [Tolypothrix sp. PCC 7601]|nr:hypothetical protein FDUTEX481_08144 [Tolypothrix sp. PCC 7601]
MPHDLGLPSVTKTVLINEDINSNLITNYKLVITNYDETLL